MKWRSTVVPRLALVQFQVAEHAGADVYLEVVGLVGAERDTIEGHFPAMEVAGDAEVTG